MMPEGTGDSGCFATADGCVVCENGPCFVREIVESSSTIEPTPPAVTGPPPPREPFSVRMSASGDVVLQIFMCDAMGFRRSVNVAMSKDRAKELGSVLLAAGT